MRRFFKWLIIVLLGLMLLIGLALLWLTKSESGLRWATTLAPDILTVEKIEGNLSDFNFSALRVSAAGTEVELSSGSLRWRLWDLLSRNVDVDDLSVRGVRVVLAAPAETTTSEPYVPWQGLDLPIDIKVQNFTLSNLTVTQSEQNIVDLDSIKTKMSLVSNRLTIDRLEVAVDQNQVNLDGEINLLARPSDKVRLKHSVDWRLPDQKIITNGEITGTWDTLQVDQSLRSPIEASASFQLSKILSETIAWSGGIETSAASPQKFGAQTIDIGAGSFETGGEFSPGKGLPSLIATLNGGVSAGSDTFSQWAAKTDVMFKQDKLTINALDLEQQQDELAGKLSINGVVDGVSGFLGDQDVSAIADLEGRWADLAWPLDGPSQIRSNGEFSLKGLPSDFAVIAKTNGESYGKPVNADVSLQVRDKVVDIKTATLSSGNASAEVAGTVGDRLNLGWSLASSDLADVWPGLSGSINSKGKVTGTAKAPEIDATAKADQVTFQDYQLSGLDVVAKGSLESPAKPLKVNANISQLQQASKTIAKDLAVDLGGSIEKFKLAISTQLFDDTDLLVRADGGLTDGAWRARLLEFDLNDPTYKRWTLKDTVTAKGRGSTLQIEQTCLINAGQSICVRADADEQTMTASGALVELDLANLNPALSLYDSKVSGLLNGEFNYVKPASQTNAEFQAELVSNDAKISLSRTTAKGVIKQDLSFASVKVNADQVTGLNVKVAAVLDNDDDLRAELKVGAPVESQDFLDAAVDGRIKAEFKDLSALPIPEETLKIAKGAVSVDTTIGGSLDEPEIGMTTRLTDAQAELPVLGLNLSDINVQAVSDDQQIITVTGQLTSGEGQLALNGSLDFAKVSEPVIKVGLSGESLQLMRTPEINVVGSVDTQISIINDLLDLRGEVSLIEADLDFQPPEDAILVSEDVIFAGQEEATKSALGQRINLNIDLGERMRVRAQGFDGNLTGRLTILQEPKGILRGKGQIDINEGRYEAYNQKLEIDRGQLIFGGGSIDDPNLDLRAQKTVNEIIAGVNVTGQASAPILSLYSTPAMQDQDILSVLIFGKPLGELGSADGLTLLRIANSLRGNGESGVTKLTERIQNSLGLSNLELQLSGDAPSVVAGKEFFSKLYIGYGYGLLDAAQSLILKYKLSSAWSINADLGADSGADLRYQIER